MGRPTRIQFPGACYHIILQGNNKQDIFLSNQDRRFFLALLRTYKERYELRVYAYCLMSNQVHLLLETQQPNLSRVMQGFNTVYTKYFNQQHNMSGHVFQGRYKALLVDKQSYLLEVTRYIHLNPVRAGLKDKPWRYPWSSCAAYVESDAREPLVDSEPVLRCFAKGRLKQSVRYLQYIKDQLKSASEPALPMVRGLFVGNQAFAAAMGGQARLGPVVTDSGEAARKILKEVMAKHGLSEEKLLGRSQWREITTVRREAVYRMWKEAKAGVSEIGRIFHRTPSAISQLIRSMESAQN